MDQVPRFRLDPTKLPQGVRVISSVERVIREHDMDFIVVAEVVWPDFSEETLLLFPSGTIVWRYTHLAWDGDLSELLQALLTAGFPLPVPIQECKNVWLEGDGFCCRCGKYHFIPKFDRDPPERVRKTGMKDIEDDEWAEQNPFLGPHPPVGGLYTFPIRLWQM